jgi:ribonuclease HII
MTFSTYIIGVDEVGRGPLAGRIFVGAVLLSKWRNANLRMTRTKQARKKLKAPYPLNDSKKLTIKQREEWFTWIKENKVPFAVSAVSPAIIDRINIARACDKAAQRAVTKLMKQNNIKRVSVIADAGILIKKTNSISSFRSFPKADEIVPVVSLASIVAKIKRDREMGRFHDKYPRYGFDGHKGYGTKKHIHAIKKYGLSPIHRLTFVRKFHKIQK